MDKSIYIKICCVCYGTYLEDIDTGRKWIECSSARWIDDDRIDDDDVDASGKLCHVCGLVTIKSFKYRRISNSLN